MYSSFFGTVVLLIFLLHYRVQAAVEKGTDIVPVYECEPVDIVFVVDGSGSVGENDFMKVKEWLVNTTTSLFHVFGESMHMAVLEYSTNIALTLKFDDNCTTMSCVGEKISKMSHSAGVTRTHAALNYTIKEVFPKSKRARFSHKVILLITDGKSSDNGNLFEWYDESVRLNITTFAVGVGRYDIQELRTLANGDKSNKRVLTVENYSSLPKEISELENKFCADIDECLTGIHECHSNASCINTYKAYNCYCKRGFEGDGRTCSDINECRTGMHSCTENYRCKNTIGGFVCVCKRFHFEDRDSCPVCSCGDVTGYATVDSTEWKCSSNDKFLCIIKKWDKQKVETCEVPRSEAFTGLFTIIRKWQAGSAALNNTRKVVDIVNKIDSIIQCVVIATNSSAIEARSTPYAEGVSHRTVLMPQESKEEMPSLPIFSESRMMHVRSQDPVYEKQTARLIAVQFPVPKSTISVFFDPVMEEERVDTWNTRHFFTGTSSLLSISAFEVKNFTYISVYTKFEINVSTDFFNESDWEQEIPGYDRQFAHEISYECHSIDTQSQTLTSNGCRATHYELGSRVTCECNHTTIFAVLLSVTTVRIPFGVQIASYVTESISVVLLLITFVILTNIRYKIRGDRINVQLCLAFCLFAFHLLNLLHDLARRNQITCIAFTVMLHYLLLVSAMWMLMEGITLVMKTNDKVLQNLNDKNKRKFFIMRHILSWSIPFLIVSVSFLVGYLNNCYMRRNPYHEERLARGDPEPLMMENTYNYCWLSEFMTLWVAIVPLAVIFLLNSIILLRMAYVVHRMSAKEDNLKPINSEAESINHAKAALKAVVLLIPILGIPWTVAFLINMKDRTSSVIFMYVTVILNGLQGLFIFVLYCIVGKDVRKAIQKKYRRMEMNRNSGFDSNRSKSKLYNSKKHAYSDSNKKMAATTKSLNLPTSNKNVHNTQSKKSQSVAQNEQLSTKL